MRDRKLYVILAIVALAIALLDVTYFNKLAVAQVDTAATAATQPESAPAPVAATVADADAPEATSDADVPAVTSPAPVPSALECNYDASMQVVQDFEKLITIADPFLGTLDAPVKVIEFFDPNCGHCRTMHPVMKNAVDQHGEIATFYMIPFVLWPYSLDQAEALYVAAQDGKYFEMLEGQYARQKAGGLSIDEIAQIATSIGMDGAQVAERVGRAMNRQSILERRQAIVDLGVRGTPSVMINGRFVETASKTPACLTEMIVAEYEAGIDG